MRTDRSLIVRPVCVLVGLCLLGGVSSADEPQLPPGVSSWKELGSLPTVMPVIAIWNGGIAMADIDPYLLYAVWADGTVLTRTPQPPPSGMKTRGDSLMVGRVAAERVQALLKKCEQAGLFDAAARKNFVTPDGPQLRMTIRHKGRQQVIDYHGRDEWEKPEKYGPNATPSWPEVKAFIKLWRNVEGKVQALTPTPRVGYTGPLPLDLPMAADILGPLPIRAAQCVRKGLPKGWTLTMTGWGFDVRRQEPIEWFNPVSLPRHDKEELKAKGYVRVATYTIQVRITQPIDPKRLAEMKEENEISRIRMRKLEGEMAHIRGKGDYLPRTPDDQKLLDEYNRLKSSLIRLPDVSTPKWSVYVRTSLAGYQSFYSQQVEDECAKVRASIETALASEGNAEEAEPSSVPSGTERK